MFLVTPHLYVGRFASRARLDELRRLRVTDIVNVSDAPSQLTIDDGPFRSVMWFDIEDRVLIPTKTAIDAIDTIHTALCADDGCVYVSLHGGMEPLTNCDLAISSGVWCWSRGRIQTICANAYDAVPGHSLLVDSNLVETVVQHGQKNFIPAPASQRTPWIVVPN